MEIIKNNRDTWYSVDNTHFFKADDFMNHFNLNESQFNYRCKKGFYYKILNGVQFNYVHIAKSNCCKITFTDTDSVTYVYNEKKAGVGDVKIAFTGIDKKPTTMYLTNIEFYKMFGFLIWFAKYPNIITDKEKVINRYGKGVKFI